MEPFRIGPQIPVGAMQTYSVVAPPDTLVAAACEQAGCLAWRHGWDSIIDESTELGRGQAAYIRSKAQRAYREMRRDDGCTVFRFEARQRCFAEHKTRPEIYSVRQGDWRGYGPARIHQRPGDWVEDMQESLDKIRGRQERG